jgi:hypothetical protein
MKNNFNILYHFKNKICNFAVLCYFIESPELKTVKYAYTHKTKGCCK